MLLGGGGKKKRETCCRGYKPLWRYLRCVAQQHLAQDPQPSVEQPPGQQPDGGQEPHATALRSAARVAGGRTPNTTATLEQLLAGENQPATGDPHSPTVIDSGDAGQGHTEQAAAASNQSAPRPPSPPQTHRQPRDRVTLPAIPPGPIWRWSGPDARGAPASPATLDARAPRNTLDHEPAPPSDGDPPPVLPPSPARSASPQVPQEPQVPGAAPDARLVAPAPPSVGEGPAILPPDFHTLPSRPRTLVPRRAPDASEVLDPPDAHSHGSPPRQPPSPARRPQLRGPASLQGLPGPAMRRFNPGPHFPHDQPFSKRPSLQTSTRPVGGGLSRSMRSDMCERSDESAGHAPPSQAQAAPPARGALASLQDSCTCRLPVSMNVVYSCYCCCAQALRVVCRSA